MTLCPRGANSVQLRTDFDRTAKCPGCLTEFNPESPAAASVELLPRVVSVADVGRAKDVIGDLKAQEAVLHAKVDELRWRVRTEKVRYSLLDIVLKFRKALDLSLSRAGECCVLPVLGAAVFFVLAHMAGASAHGLFLVSMFGAFVALGLAVAAVFYPVDQTIAAFSVTSERLLITLNAILANVAEQLVNHQARVTMAESHYHRLRVANESRLNWLRSCRWKSMTGGDFEKFLAEVFAEHGYQVELAGKTGDQGVDLIVMRAGICVAVQAKGYTAGTVGNGVVQETHTGMALYCCHRSVVVTNSRFTASAVTLANSIGCKLIDGDQNPT